MTDLSVVYIMRSAIVPALADGTVVSIATISTSCPVSAPLT
jgi:hypothetical protein